MTAAPTHRWPRLAVSSIVFVGLALSSLAGLTLGRAQDRPVPDASPDAGPPDAGTPEARAPTLPAPDPSAGGGHGSITDGVDCIACHTTEGWSLLGGGRAGRGFDHARTGFPLTARHRGAACGQCHRSGEETRRACVSCHEDEHQGRLGRSCDRCHSARGWSDTRPLELHRATRLPLTGMHALADCTQCHVRTGEREWSAPPAECVSCHADDAAIDVHPDHLGRSGAPPFPRDCALCHRPSGWSPAIVDPATLPLVESLVAPPDHEARFRISSGSHRGLSCDGCHVEPESPRRIECVGCHAHDRTRLAASHRGTPIATDGAGCLHCHPGGMRR